MNRVVYSLVVCVLFLAGCGAQQTGTQVPAAAAIDRSLTVEINKNSSNTEAYDAPVENPFILALSQPQSTFAIDVDTASYSNVLRIIQNGQLPPKGAVRLEECVNYFTYHYPEPTDQHPLAIMADVGPCPWNSAHQLVRVALKGKSVTNDSRPPCNLVFLIDVSGSMADEKKLPLVQWSLKLLASQLDDRDRIGIVAYAGSAGIVLPSTPGDQVSKITRAIDSLRAGGSTNGAGGIAAAYKMAKENFDAASANRVIMCTDGDFNVGVNSQSDLVDLITREAQSNVFLSVLGFGMGNLKDSTLEKLADHGNGNYAYIDHKNEARKVFQQQIGGTLVTIAKDVKIQLDFNPNFVKSYRLLGYENRVMGNQDFRKDEKDAGELGAGHTVTAFYEVAPADSQASQPTNRDSEFVTNQASSDRETLLTVNLRYKLPLGDQATEIQKRLSASTAVAQDEDFRLATAVLGFGMLLRGSEYKGQLTWDWVAETARSLQGNEQRNEFVRLVDAARQLDGAQNVGWTPRKAGS